MFPAPLLLLVAAAVSPPAGVEPPQGRPPADAGSTIRVTYDQAEPGRAGKSKRTVVGTLLRLDDREILLRGEDGASTVVRSDRVLRLEVAQGRHHRGRGAAIGAAVGAALGLVGTAVWRSGCSDPECDLGLGFGLLLYTPAAAGAGALVGVALPPARRWVPWPGRRLETGLGSTVSFNPGSRRASAALTFSF
jgi:hypothetical protein